jgi:hypothetical protein
MDFPRRFSIPRYSAFATISLFPLLAGTAFAQQTAPPPPPVENPPNPPASLAAPAPTEKAAAPSRRIRFGPQLGLYFPTNSRTRNRFGSTWTNIGIGIGSISDIHRSGRLALDVSFISNTRSSDAKIFLAPIGLSYSIGLGKQTQPTAAYAGVSANLVIASLRSDLDGLPSRTSATGGASLFLGTRFSESGYVEARYNAFGKIRSFDLSGINLTAGFRF